MPYQQIPITRNNTPEALDRPLFTFINPALSRIMHCERNPEKHKIYWLLSHNQHFDSIEHNLCPGQVLRFVVDAVIAPHQPQQNLRFHKIEIILETRTDKDTVFKGPGGRIRPR